MGQTLNSDNLNKLVEAHLAIEAEEAKEAGALGYMARALTQATMPHRNIADNEFVRRNGAFELTMIAPRAVGLPYGSKPRLLLAWMTTEAVRTKDRHLEMGPSLSAFMSEIGLIPKSGRWGASTVLKTQAERLFQCSVSCNYNVNDNNISGLHNEGYRIAHKSSLWWHTKQPDQMPLWKSSVTLSTEFFNEVINNPIPVDKRALHVLKSSSMALDIYCWLTYRNSYLKRKTAIPWASLQMQFGSGYPMNTSRGKRNFKLKFCEHLKKIRVVYPDARFDFDEDSLILKPSPTHVFAS